MREERENRMKTQRIRERSRKIGQTFAAMFLLLLGVPIPSVHGEMVDLRVSLPSVESGKSEIRLRAGFAPGASKGYDPGLDLPALLLQLATDRGPLPFALDVLQAAFIQNDLDPRYPDIAGLLVDMRTGDQLPQTWRLEIRSPRSGPVTVDWTAGATSSGTCGGISWALRDTFSGSTVPLAGPGPYIFQAEANVPRELDLEAAPGRETLLPPAPRGLWSPAGGRRTVLLFWDRDRDPAIVGYHVYRAATPEGPFVRLTDRPLSHARFLDRRLTPGRSYAYHISSVGEGGCEGDLSAPIIILLRR